MVLGLALVHRPTDAERDQGQQVLAEVRDWLMRHGHSSVGLPVASLYLARDRARQGERDDAIPLIRAALDQLLREGRSLGWGIPRDGCFSRDAARTRGRWGRARSRGRDRAVSHGAHRRRSASARDRAAAATGSGGASPNHRSSMHEAARSALFRQREVICGPCARTADILRPLRARALRSPRHRRTRETRQLRQPAPATRSSR
jgi:hypothetical protein